MVAGIILLSGQAKGQTYNYAEALQKSLYFYDAEKSGPGITGGRLPWRGNSEVCDATLPLNTTMTDMSQTFITANKSVLDPGNKGYVDVSGGYHDAGDHVKFGLPQSYASSTVEWSLYEFKDAFVNIGEINHIRDITKWFSDYYLRCTFMNPAGKVVAFCYQVGDGDSDHTFWGPPEIVDRTKITRPGYFATTENPASDQCAGAAASLALSYLNDKADSTAYANRCLTTAKALYDFAVQYRNGKMGYSGGYYNSSFDEDELSWAAIWLYVATNDAKYLNDIIGKDANGNYTGWLSRIIHSVGDSWQNIWVHSWDTKWGGVFAKLAPITNDPFYWYIFRWNLEYWSGVPHANTSDGTFLAKTPAGFSMLNSYGSARYNAAAQLQAVVYKKYAANSDFDSWTISQMQYIMGKNPLNRSYIVGYGNSAKHPHHRAAHGSATNSMFDPPQHRHILYGGLVGGPGAQDEHKDTTNDFVYNEVAVDYNAGLVGALAGLYTYFGAVMSPIANFYPTDPPTVEFGIESRIERESNQASQICLRVQNNSAYPPRINVPIVARYYFNVSELFPFNQSISDITTAIYYDESAATGTPVVMKGPIAWDAANGVYYMEFQWPAAGFYGKRELQFALISGQDPVLFTTHWDPTNDYSHQGLTTTYANTLLAPMYIDGKLAIGKEPPIGVNVPVTSVTLAPTTATVNIGTTSQLAATILPANATNKAVTWSSSNTLIATVSATGLVTGAAVGSATITATTQDGLKTATCVVTVTNTVILVTGVAVTPASASVNIGATLQIAATIAPATATNKAVTWSSSNTTIATVSATGLVTGMTVGSATITVTTQDGLKTATCAVTVTNTVISVTGVTLMPTTASVNIGATAQLTATVAPATASNKVVTWGSSNVGIATVSATGLVTGVAVGSATITVTTQDGLKTATCVVTVTNTIIPVTGVTLTPATASVNVGATAQLTATIAPTTATNKAVTWSSGNTAIATVSSTGLITGVAVGSTTITVTTQDGLKTATCVVTVNTVTIPPCSFGTPLATTLASLNKAYTYIYVLGTGGPNLSNVSNLTINWDLANKGLWQLSMNTKDGKPNWYVDLRAGTTQTFASVQPSITFAGTGFTGLDGSYYAAIDNGNLVLVSKTVGFTLYFSTSATAPVCIKSAEGSSSLAEGNIITLFPNPFATAINLHNSKPELVTEVYVVNQLGSVVLRVNKSQISNDMYFGNELPSGMYIVKVVSVQTTSAFKIIKK